MDNKVVWIFHHLPKTGGTTLILHLYKHYEWDVEYLHIGPFGSQYRGKNKRPYLFERTVEERKKVKVLSGPRVFDGIHKFIPNKEPKYFTFVRCPAKRFESMYNFHLSRKIIPLTTTFQEWYETRPKNEIMTWYNDRLYNLMPKQSTLKNVIDFFDKCWFIGLTENLKEDLSKIFEAMNIPSENLINYRVAGQENALKELAHHPDKNHKYDIYYKMNQATQDFIYADNPIDVEIYQYAQIRNRETRKNL